MNYTINGQRYVANEGYVFKSKKTDYISQSLYLGEPNMIDNYDVIVEPVIEEIEDDMSTMATETDYINNPSQYAAN